MESNKFFKIDLYSLNYVAMNKVFKYFKAHSKGGCSEIGVNVHFLNRLVRMKILTTKEEEVRVRDVTCPTGRIRKRKFYLLREDIDIYELETEYKVACREYIKKELECRKKELKVKKEAIAFLESLDF